LQGGAQWTVGTGHNPVTTPLVGRKAADAVKSPTTVEVDADRYLDNQVYDCGRLPRPHP